MGGGSLILKLLDNLIAKSGGYKIRVQSYGDKG